MSNMIQSGLRVIIGVSAMLSLGLFENAEGQSRSGRT